MEETPTENLEIHYQVGDMVYAHNPDVPLIHNGAIVEIREINEEKRTVIVDLHLFGRAIPISTPIDFKDIHPEKKKQ